ncbi:MAG: glycosyltransferase [Verrucomicrobiae bacterium]|nr:glycosyltransferase [Verrucomicrobiae bacterium]
MSESHQGRSATPRVSANSKFFFHGGRKFFVKGVTYGPFPPREEGGTPVFLPTTADARDDFARMTDAGINTVRLYHPPPLGFLDECAAAGLKAYVTIPWEQHVCFLDARTTRRSIRERVVAAGRARRDHPAIFAWAIGNEIPTGIVRWYGSRKIEAFLEELLDAARQADPRPLYTYANYPPTEYLLPGAMDFFSYNVYLHRARDFEGYLSRLQNLAGEKPLILSEFGMDTVRHSEEEQAALLRGHIEAVARHGLAGTILFSWTDEWFTGGHLVEDWKFGLVTAARAPKKALAEVRALFKGSPRVPLPRVPPVSVIVCSYNGARTLEACLTSLLQMDYPDFEVILVDDGSTDSTEQIVRDFPKVRYLKQENLGLSVARNVGLRAARGEIIAYTDSDCMADKDWLYYLVGTLEQGGFAAAGGPNVSPPAQNWVQACVAASPGQPSHVLIDDMEAEHIPGCNMAFHRWALELIGGFDPEYRKAGDDVDLCWRLMQRGHRIGFSPSAIVWHHRRFNVRAYLRQQEGYGEAEALLRFKHLVYFGPTGSARWRGRVYGGTNFSSLLHRPIVYHGVFGMGLFQCVYPSRTSDLVLFMSSLEWNVAALVALLVALQIHAIWYLPAVMFAGSLSVAASYALHARVEARSRRPWSRLLIVALAFWQPIARGWARYSTWARKKRTPRRVVGAASASRAQAVEWDRPALLSFWSEAGVGREQFLSAFQKRLEQEGWKSSADTGWSNWDYQVYGNRLWQIRVLSLTEEHGDGKRLTRVRLHPSPTVFSRMVAIPVAVVSFLAWLRFEATTSPQGYRLIGVWFCAVTLWLAILLLASARLRHRVAQIVELAAQDLKLATLRARRKWL